MANSIAELKKQLKNGDIKDAYLFYGEEKYLINLYIERILDIVPDGGFEDFNRLVVEDAKTPPAEISDFIDTYPMMAEKKVLIMRDTGVLKSANDAVKDFWTTQLADIPDYMVIIFAESEIDKRSVIYKALSKAGYVLEFAPLSVTDTVTWIERQFLDAKIKIKKENAEYLAEVSGGGLSLLKNEVDKLINFCENEVTKSDIDRLCPKSLNIKVFEMTDAIIEKMPDKALLILHDMKSVGESAFKILYILFSAFDKMLYANLMLKEGETADIIAQKLKLPSFIARKYMKKTFSEKFLAECISKIACIDLSIKEGRTDEWTALEQFVAGLFER